eukprot:TCONS_00040666-protein
MTDYSTDSFILSFTRFACHCGYPKKLYCDGGSQLIKGCTNMTLDFKDLQSRLHRDKAIEFSINDLPICVQSKTNVENLDLITPNRLLLGRNNERSPVGDMMLSSNPSKLMRSNEAIYNVWFESWLLNHVPRLMTQSKWFKNSYQFQIGDIVLFKKKRHITIENVPVWHRIKG